MLLNRWARKLSKFARKSLSELYEKPLPPPTEKEEHLIEELRDAFRNLPDTEGADDSTAHQEWINYVNQLKQLVLNDDPREFLRWHVISGTMFAKYRAYIGPEFSFLKKRTDWKTRWSKAVKESLTGHPTPYWRCPHSSGNLIHHAYHLARFEEKTEMRIDNLNNVFEFGGGYGSMCRLFHNCGFRGKYVIFDLPGFSALQRFFLKSTAIRVHSIESFREAEDGVLCISDLDCLREILSSCFDTQMGTFVANWSISETPVTIRNSILPLVSPFRTFLISYQHKFKEIDNLAFFMDWKLTQQEIQWYDWEIEHIPQNSYLIGVRVIH
ncbi:MAG: hypothetical protein ACYS8Z_05915 [Planctomycetota bacterium]|jgi:hypothetical protein